MEQIYDRIIQLCVYDDINTVASFNDIAKKITKIVNKLDDTELSDLRLHVYKKKVEYQNSKEMTFSSHFPFILILPSVFSGYLGTIFLETNGILAGLGIMIVYALICGFVIIRANNKLIREHTNRIESHVFLEKIIDEEIKNRDKQKENSRMGLLKSLKHK